MGILADIYVSRDDEAIKYDTVPDQFAERAKYKSITPLELSMLWAIMQGIQWDVALMDEFPCLLQINSGERLIHGLPAAMVVELTRLTPEKVADVSPKWAAIEELCRPPEEARPVVEDLVRLSLHAAESGQSVYLWNCV